MLYHIAYAHDQNGFGWVAMRLAKGIRTVEDLNVVQERIREKEGVRAVILTWRPLDSQAGQ